MRRASGPQSGSSNFYLRKDNTNKIKSPSHAKVKSRGKITQEASTSHVIPTRKGNSFSKNQQNQSSTFFTTQNNKTKKSQFGPKKPKDLKKYQKQIMEVLHSSASIIQRQWRKYLIRKYRKSLQEKKVNKQLKKPIQNIQFDSISARTSQNSQAYNNKKYYSVQGEQKKKISQNSFNKNVFSFNLSDKKTRFNNISPQKYEKIKVQSKIKVIHETGHNRTRSDEPVVPFLSSKSKIKHQQNYQQKCLEMVPNIISVKIQNHSPQKKKKKIKSNQSIKSKQQIKYQDHFIKNQKEDLDQILKKLQNQLEQKRLKKILALENSFSSNLMTFRSYQKNIENVAEEHNKKLNLLQGKKKKLLDKFNQFVNFCENNILQQKQQEDDRTSETAKKQKPIPQTQNHHIDLSFNDQISGVNSRSIRFDQWDLDVHFSDKKIPDMNKKYIPIEKKDQQMLIQQSEKDITINNTLINQLASNQDHNVSQSKNNSSQKKFKQDFELLQRPINKIESQIIKIQNIDESLGPEQSQSLELQKAKFEQIKKETSKIQTKVKVQQHLIPSKQQSPNKISIDELKNPKHVNFNVKRFSQQQVKQQLKKFHPIKPNIDVVNNWLLEISHFILDNFGGQFLKKLIAVEQPQPIQVFRHCVSGQPFIRQYCSVSQKIFKQFQFFHIKTIITDEDVQNSHKQSFSALMYTFHQSLYDCLNKMLLDQLIEGRNWIKFPWSNQFKVKKLVGPDHSKQCLQKAINRVSNISDYNITPIDPTIQFGREFEQTQHNLIFAQQVKQIPIQCQFQRGHLLYKLSILIFKQVIEQQIKVFTRIL